MAINFSSVINQKRDGDNIEVTEEGSDGAMRSSEGEQHSVYLHICAGGITKVCL